MRFQDKHAGQLGARGPRALSVANAALAHRALSDEARLRLFSLISESDRALDVPTMSDALGLHPNTVWSHLRRLESAALVVSEFEVRTARGRPRRLFTLGPAAAAVGQGARDYKLLATMLAAMPSRGRAILPPRRRLPARRGVVISRPRIASRPVKRATRGLRLR